MDYRPVLTGPLSKALKSYGVVRVARFSAIAAFAVFRSWFHYYCFRSKLSFRALSWLFVFRSWGINACAFRGHLPRLDFECLLPRPRR